MEALEFIISLSLELFKSIQVNNRDLQLSEYMNLYLETTEIETQVCVLLLKLRDDWLLNLLSLFLIPNSF